MAGIAEHGDGLRTSGRRMAAWATVVALILLVPLFAMQVTDEVDWTAGDFVFAGAFLFGAGVVFELALRVTSSLAYRAAAGVALAGALMLVWVNGAVGIIGTEDDAANLMYGGVLAVGIIGAIIARFRAGGMARAMFATALAQGLVGAIALIGGLGSDTDPDWPRAILGLTAFVVALWLLSAGLFRTAARQRTLAANAATAPGAD